MDLFGRNLKFLREKAGLKQAEMIALLDFGQTTWNNYERGKSFPNVADLVRISKYFGVSETDLLHANLSDGVHLIPEKTEGKKGGIVQPIVQATVQPKRYKGGEIEGEIPTLNDHQTGCKAGLNTRSEDLLAAILEELKSQRTDQSRELNLLKAEVAEVWKQIEADAAMHKGLQTLTLANLSDLTHKDLITLYKELGNNVAEAAGLLQNKDKKENRKGSPSR